MSNPTKIVLALVGIALGIGVATAVVALPGSAPINRLEAVWRPSLREARRGEAALSRGDTTGAQLRFDRAMRQTEGVRNQIRLLDFINEACRRSEAWTLSSQYSRLLLQKRDSLLDQVRYGEAMFELGNTDQAEALFLSVIGVRLKPDAPAIDRLAQVLAARGEASILETRGTNLHRVSDLNRASALVEGAIKAALKDGDSSQVLASLNDTLAWVQYNLAATTGQQPDLELARVYSETAVDDLFPAADPSETATILYHLSRIHAAEGDRGAATKAYRTALKASAATVRRLEKAGVSVTGAKTKQDSVPMKA